ncbi:zinc-binding alcohol dehydrogenase family protein [Scytonema sp. NUACC26]|uniref:quinone oxidoreductase family protein n=1 Tax=Scytonema sp. NUACC26 TaxID=3140176 RepID=UPI0034DB85B2
MRNVAICGSHVKNFISSPSFVTAIEMDGVPIFCGLIHTEDIKFDRHIPENRFKVLVRKIAFSYNYRDKNLIFTTAIKAALNRFYVVGSEFVGEVIDIGSDVTDFQIGDKVIGNNHYPNSGIEGVPGGLPSNNSSTEYQVFHQIKLIKVPPQIPDEVAATISIGGQTTYSMLRKLSLTEGSNVLVTSANSNTSLFAINALNKHKVNIYATTTSMRFEKELKEMGVKRLIQIEPNSENWVADELAEEIVKEKGSFDCIIDPFFDIHIGKLIPLLASGGRYITCGFYDQYSSLIGKEFQYRGLTTSEIFVTMMLKNIQIIGNCIGKTEDLQNAIQDYASGSLNVVIDSVFSGKQVGEFFERTYNAKDRFGKVVYRYD